MKLDLGSPCDRRQGAIFKDTVFYSVEVVAANSPVIHDLFTVLFVLRSLRMYVSLLVVGRLDAA